MTTIVPAVVGVVGPVPVLVTVIVYLAGLPATNGSIWLLLTPRVTEMILVGSEANASGLPAVCALALLVTLAGAPTGTATTISKSSCPVVAGINTLLVQVIVVEPTGVNGQVK